MTCALRVRCSTTELRRPGQKNCIRPATFRVIASGVLHRMVQGEAKQSRVVWDCFGPSGLAMTEERLQPPCRGPVRGSSGLVPGKDVSFTRRSGILSLG